MGLASTLSTPSAPVPANPTHTTAIATPRPLLPNKPWNCDNCHKRGHTKDQCWAQGSRAAGKVPTWYVLKTQMDKQAWQNKPGTTHIASIPDVILMADTFGQGCHMQWILDSGASTHMMNSMDYFSSYEPFLQPLPITVKRK